MSTTRRGFCKQVALAGTAAAISGLAGSARAVTAFFDRQRAGASAQPVARPVVSFHLDQPYLDSTGHGVPYRPPAGLRSAEGIAEMSEEALHSLLLYRL
ncbi:MAG: hypothetical protein IRZ28_11305 [Steroidobacteraceae bacterium]|nr:hypothetical protein [Steroidobacteraceae bacterium]